MTVSCSSRTVQSVKAIDFHGFSGSTYGIGCDGSGSSSAIVIRSATAKPSGLYTRHTRFCPGFVIFSKVSDTLIFGKQTLSLFTATSLYTAPNTGSLFAVISRSPTPKESMRAPCSSSEWIVNSSRLFDATIMQSSSPAASSIFRAFFDRYARSPESSRMPFRRLPIGISTSFATRIAFGTPDASTS